MNDNGPPSMRVVPAARRGETESDGPPSANPNRSVLPAPVPEPTFFQMQLGQTLRFVGDLGEVAQLTARTFRSLFRRPYEWEAIVYQLDSLGVKSLGIVTVTSTFIGMVMTIQFAFGLRRFGGLEYIPRVIVLSFARELAPSLTAIIVGGRIGSGMAAEVGAMNVTEQVDAIRALGADPAKKLVLPRVVASIIAMPILSVYALMLGCIGAIVICKFQFDIPAYNFYKSALEAFTYGDFFSGWMKTPFFGFIIAILGCHFGLKTTGGTEGVGLSTTRTVVVVSIALLIADFLLTRLFIVGTTAG